MKEILIITSIHPDFDQRIWKHCKTVKRLGYNVTLLCQWESIKKRKVVDGINIINFGTLGARRFRMLRNNIKLLFFLLKSKKFEIYHFHDIDILPVMTLFSCFNNVIYDIHENYPEEMLERYWVPTLLRRPLYYLVWFYQYLSVRVIRNVVLVAESQIKKMPTKLKYIYIYNYASYELYGEAHEVDKEFDFITTATQYKENGIEVLIHAVRKFKENGKKIEVCIMDRFSSSDYRSMIISMILKYDLSDYIKIIDKVLPHKLPFVLSKARVGLVLDLDTLRRRKAIPTKIFEYLASGLLVVGSDLPNTVRYLSDEFGCLFKAGDPESLYTAMNSVLQMEVSSSSIRGVFESNYSWESQDKVYADYYSDILSGKN